MQVAHGSVESVDSLLWITCAVVVVIGRGMCADSEGQALGTIIFDHNTSVLL